MQHILGDTKVTALEPVSFYKNENQAPFITLQSFSNPPGAMPGQQQPSPPTTHTPATITAPSFILEPTNLLTQFPMKSGESPIELMVNLWDTGASQISLIPSEVQNLSLGQGITL